MREIVAMLGWLTPLYLVCVYSSLPNEIKLLLFNIFIFAYDTGLCPGVVHVAFFMQDTVCFPSFYFFRQIYVFNLSLIIFTSLNLDFYVLLIVKCCHLVRTDL